MRRMAGALLVVCVAAASAAAQDTGALQKGVQAFNSGDYAGAADLFQAAAAAEPQALLPRQQLANARLQLFHAAEGPERVPAAETVRTALKDVLALNPQDGWSLWTLAWLDMQTDQIGGAAKACAALLAAEPENKDGHYTMAVIRWMDAYRAAAQARRRAGMQAGDPPPIRDAAIREALRASVAGKIEEGHRALEKALALDPQFQNALLYDNLLYRTEAYSASSEADARALLARADQRIQAAMALKPVQMPAGPGRVSAREAPPRVAPVPAPPPPPPPPGR